MGKIRQFNDEFKKRAVSLALTSDLTQMQTCDELNISHGSLSRWVREERVQTGTDSKEVASLKAENKQLKLENSFLNGCAVYFAQTSNQGIK